MPDNAGMDNLYAAFLCTLGAGLATTLGSAAAFFVRLHDKQVLASSLGLSAGVMIYVSLVEVLNGSREKFLASLVTANELDTEAREPRAMLYATIFFFVGVIVTGILDLLLHKISGGHSHSHGGDDQAAISSALSSDIEKPDMPSKNESHLKRASFVAAIAVALHNIPEGLTTFMTTLKDAKVGLSVSFAIGLHNALEGLCISMPLYFATGSRWRAFLCSAGSGAVQFLGAILGYLVLMAFMGDFSFGIVFALVGGMMLFVSVRELLPLARHYDPDDRVVTLSLLIGMFFMAICLCIE